MKADKRLTELAGAICLEAPLEQPQHATDAKIPWTLIHKLRERLEALGYDWRAMWGEVKAKDVAHRESLTEQRRAK